MIQACVGWQSKGHLVGSVFFIILKNPIRKKKWSWKHIVKAPSMELIDFCYLFLISVVCSHIICSHLYSHHACEHVSRPPGLGLVQPSTCAGCKRSLCCPVVQEDSVTQNLELLSTSTHIETTIIRYNLFEMTIFVATLAAYISSHHTREWKLKSWTAKSFFFCRPILEWFYWSHAVQRVDSSSFAEFEMGRFDCFLGEALTPLDHQFPGFPAIEWSRFFLGGVRIAPESPGASVKPTSTLAGSFIESRLAALTFVCWLAPLLLMREIRMVVGPADKSFGCQVRFQELLSEAALFQLCFCFGLSASP